MGRALSPKSLSGSTDLEDMSVMVLRTQGPTALFDDHRLILHTSSYDAKRARVFHVCGEFTPLPRCPEPVDSPAQAPSRVPWGLEEQSDA